MAHFDRVIQVTGSRYWSDRERVLEALEPYADERVCLYHGGAPGLDTIAGEVAQGLGWEVIEVPALWNLHGKSAGPIRNKQMLDMSHLASIENDCPLITFAFKENFDHTLSRGGTEHMVKIMKERGIIGTLFE